MAINNQEMIMAIYFVKYAGTPEAYINLEFDNGVETIYKLILN